MSSKPLISVVVRTLNEATSLKLLLQSLSSQEGIAREQVEIIVVDNESTDNTQEVAQSLGARVVVISRGEFTYPKSMNLGMSSARAPLVALTVGHAEIISSTWLRDGMKHFVDQTVAGVYGPCVPLREHTLAESLVYMPGYALAKLHAPKAVGPSTPGIMGATNCIIRRELWQGHPFDESFELGGEDVQWAKWAIATGYQVIRDPAFTVRHSHHLGWVGMVKQLIYWHKLQRPTRFTRDALQHRTRINWN